MDKRTLLFFFGLTAIFFLMNQWLNKGTVISNGSTIQQPKTTVHILSETKKPRVLSIEEAKKFGVVKLYRDIALNDFYTYAILRGGNYLTISPEDTVPEQLYAPTLTQRIASTELISLRVPPSETGAPILYSVYPLAKLELPYVPDEGRYDVNVIYFDNETIYEVAGQFNTIKQLSLEAQPGENALVLLNTQGTIAPFGSYSVANNSLTYLSYLPHFDDFSLLHFPQSKELKKELTEQQHYVIQNEYQQLVFTNVNGSIIELNLPFRTETNQSSVVLPTEVDHTLLEDYPQSDLFPLVPYYVPKEGGGMEKISNPQIGGYYQLLRRTLLGPGGQPASRVNPYYYCLNVFEKRIEHEPELYELKRFEKNLIEFELNQGHRRITKTYFVPEDPSDAPYIFYLDVKIEGDTRDLHVSVGVPEVALISGSFSPTLKYRQIRNGKAKVENIKPPKTITTFSHINPDWVCNGNGFFGIVADPLTRTPPGFSAEQIAGELVPTRLSLIDAQYQRYPADKYPGYSFSLPLPNKPGVTRYRVFAGPLDKKILQKLDQVFMNPETGLTPDYTACQSYHGFFAIVSEPFAKFLFVLLNFFHSFTGSWGISIILLTIALRAMLYPLNNWSFKANARMQKIAPKVTALQEKYKKDPKKAQMEIMELYRREKANPLKGCFPMLIQLPFLFGMLDLLKSSFALRGASFIPGWIDNLSAPDILFTWKYPIFFFGNSFHLLPFILGGVMFFQQRMMAKSRTKGAETDQQRQQRAMGNVITVVFTFMFYNFPSGLNIYWISSSLLGILQQWWVYKRTLAEPEKPVVKK